MTDFKPMLLVGSKPSKPFNIEDAIAAAGKHISDYIVLIKKDGVRGEIKLGEVLGRSLKPIRSSYVQKMYGNFLEMNLEFDVLEGEFWGPGLTISEIVHFVNSKELSEAKQSSKRGEYAENFPNRTFEWLCTWPPELKFYPFDMYYHGSNLPASARVSICYVLSEMYPKLFGWLPAYNMEYLESPALIMIPHLYQLYFWALENKHEGLVLMDKTATYKCGRVTQKEAIAFKMKDDNLEFDGKIIAVEESTVVIDGAPKTTNELGRSVTSKLQEHRTPSGLAKGFIVDYEGHEFTVCLQGYSHTQLKEIWDNRDNYVGRWFVYTGMQPVKHVPRHAFFKHWRDDK